MARSSRAGLAVDGPTPARCGRWRVWLRGHPEGVGRLAGQHELGEASAAEVLAALLDRLGPARALPQLEGHWHALLADGDTATVASARMGTGGWFWSRAGDGEVVLADSPAALATPGEADPAALRRALLGAPRADGETVWPTVTRVEAGARLTVACGLPQAPVAWWSPDTPPPGRAGHRGVWDRAACHALVLGVTRATRAGDWALCRGGLSAEALLEEAAPTVPQAVEGPAPLPPPEALAALPEPRLSDEALALAGAVWGAPAGLRRVVAVGAAQLLGAAASRRAGPEAWRQAVRVDLPADTVAPLQALSADAALAPALAHPAAVAALGRVPWRHLRGLRGSMGARMGVQVVRPAPHPPVALPATLGPVPPSAAGRAAVLAAWLG